MYLIVKTFCGNLGLQEIGQRRLDMWTDNQTILFNISVDL
jgi:hypothetical protein